MYFKIPPLALYEANNTRARCHAQALQAEGGAWTDRAFGCRYRLWRLVLRPQ